MHWTFEIVNLCGHLSVLVNNRNWHPKISSQYFLEIQMFGWVRLVPSYQAPRRYHNRRDSSTLISDSCWLLVVANQFSRSQSILSLVWMPFRLHDNTFCIIKWYHGTGLSGHNQNFPALAKTILHLPSFTIQWSFRLCRVVSCCCWMSMHLPHVSIVDLSHLTWCPRCDQFPGRTRSKDVLLRCSKLFLVNCWHRVWKAHW